MPEENNNTVQQERLSDEELNTIIERAKDFFRNEIVPRHVAKAGECRNLNNFRLNPFLDKYKAAFIKGDCSPRSIAEALVYPRVIGTSLNTIFGNQVQKFCHVVLEGFSSLIPGLDIEFIDKVDSRRKYCQVKASTNTINSGDVKTIKDHFTDIRNLARTNNANIGFNDLVVGVFYGEHDELNAHYKKLERDHPVIVGAEFWYRLTGNEDFYQRITGAISEVALEYDGREIVESIVVELERQIADSLTTEDE